MKSLRSSLISPSFWKGKRVFLTGHTGFKGSWLSIWLSSMGAEITGFSLPPNTDPNLFDILRVSDLIQASYFSDIRNFSELHEAMTESQPEIVIHLAAQPLVRYSYSNPIETYATNVMGTVHLLEAIKNLGSVRATVVVTSDKCYENKEWIWGYREYDPMGGYDPYSNSKGCAELVTSAFRQSYFPESLYTVHKHALASARAGNVIGGGDWSEDRLIPDALRAFESGLPLMIRNPLATRPWQHVLEPLSGYLMLAQSLYSEGSRFAGAWNFGPKEGDARPVQDVINLLIKSSPAGATWLQDKREQPHEAHSLKLDCSKANQLLNWFPKWSLETAIIKITDWQKAFFSRKDMRDITLAQIMDYEAVN